MYMSCVAYLYMFILPIDIEKCALIIQDYMYMYIYMYIYTYTCTMCMGY